MESSLPTDNYMGDQQVPCNICHLYFKLFCKTKLNGKGAQCKTSHKLLTSLILKDASKPCWELRILPWKPMKINLNVAIQANPSQEKCHQEENPSERERGRETGREEERERERWEERETERERPRVRERESELKDRGMYSTHFKNLSVIKSITIIFHHFLKNELFDCQINLDKI